MPGKRGFRSKAQWRMAFARKMPWARRWANRSRSYRSLPPRRRRR
ncbi:hypothetical protein [Streptomyces sp. CB02366]|nr:hypothetical protein [Streptomyces sp. CB02366]